jgi:hypothetical protein
VLNLRLINYIRNLNGSIVVNNVIEGRNHGLFSSIVACRPIARQRPRNRQRPLLGNGEIVFSARSAPIAAHATMDTVTEERCVLCGPCQDVISRTVSECS